MFEKLMFWRQASPDWSDAGYTYDDTRSVPINRMHATLEVIERILPKYQNNPYDVGKITREVYDALPTSLVAELRQEKVEAAIYQQVISYQRWGDL